MHNVIVIVIGCLNIYRPSNINSNSNRQFQYMT